MVGIDTVDCCYCFVLDRVEVMTDGAYYNAFE